jgi:hypothetical protein
VELVSRVPGALGIVTHPFAVFFPLGFQVCVGPPGALGAAIVVAFVVGVGVGGGGIEAAIWCRRFDRRGLDLFRLLGVD